MLSCQGLLNVVDPFKHILLKEKYNKLLGLQHLTKLTISIIDKSWIN